MVGLALVRGLDFTSRLHGKASAPTWTVSLKMKSYQENVDQEKKKNWKKKIETISLICDER